MKENEKLINKSLALKAEIVENKNFFKLKIIEKQNAQVSS